MNLSPELAKTSVSSLATDLLIPLTADRIALDGQMIQLPDAIKAAAQTAAGNNRPSEEITDQQRAVLVAERLDGAPVGGLGEHCRCLAPVRVRIGRDDSVRVTRQPIHPGGPGVRVDRADVSGEELAHNESERDGRQQTPAPSSSAIFASSIFPTRP